MLEIDQANGIFVTDTSGKSYYDFISGISVSNLGHNNPDIKNAIKQQADSYLHIMAYGEHIQQPQVDFAHKLINLLPSSLNALYPVNSGAEATETAMKLAKKVTGKPEILHCNYSYHGSTQGALSLAGTEDFKSNFRPLIPGISSIPFNDLQGLEEIDDSTAAVFIEPIQGEAGIRLPDSGFLKKLQQKCREKGALLIFDEIQTGFGRTGSLFAFEQLEVVPDVMLIGKAMGGGMPLGGVIASNAMLNAFTENPMLGHITTFGGHPICCAAAKASLDIITKLPLKSSAEDFERLIENKLQHPMIKEKRGKGWFWAIDLHSEEKTMALCIKARENGLLVDFFLFCPGAVRIAPPINISQDEAEEALDILMTSMNEASDDLSNEA